MYFISSTCNMFYILQVLHNVCFTSYMFYKWHDRCYTLNMLLIIHVTCFIGSMVHMFYVLHVLYFSLLICYMFYQYVICFTCFMFYFYMFHVPHFSSFQCKIFYMWHVIFHVTWYSYNLRACIIFDLLMKILLNDFLEFAAENEIGLSWAWRVGMGIILAMVSKKIEKK